MMFFLFVVNSRVLLMPVPGSLGNLSRRIPNPLIVHDMFRGCREIDSRFFLMSADTATILQFLQRKKPAAAHTILASGDEHRGGR
jgi:hypothetical protein